MTIIVKIARTYILTIYPEAEINIFDTTKDIFEIFEDVIFTKEYSYCLYVVFKKIAKCFKITVGIKNIWTTLKKTIDNQINSILNNTAIVCNICFDTSDYGKHINYKMIGCIKCCNTYCVDCYIEVKRQNNGFTVCPYCRHKHGEFVRVEHLERYLTEIKNKIINEM